MSKELTLYDVSRMLKDAGFPQPELAAGQHWYSRSGSAVLVSAINTIEAFGSQVVFIASGRFETLPLPLHNLQKILFYTYQPTIEDIMPKLPKWLSLECDVDRKTGEVTWSLVTRRHGLIMVDDLHWIPDPQKHPVIACGLAWLYFHSKKADHGKVDTE